MTLNEQILNLHSNEEIYQYIDEYLHNVSIQISYSKRDYKNANGVYASSNLNNMLDELLNLDINILNITVSEGPNAGKTIWWLLSSYYFNSGVTYRDFFIDLVTKWENNITSETFRACAKNGENKGKTVWWNLTYPINGKWNLTSLYKMYSKWLTVYDLRAMSQEGKHKGITVLSNILSSTRNWKPYHKDRIMIFDLIFNEYFEDLTLDDFRVKRFNVSKEETGINILAIVFQHYPYGLQKIFEKWGDNLEVNDLFSKNSQDQTVLWLIANMASQKPPKKSDLLNNFNNTKLIAKQCLYKAVLICSGKITQKMLNQESKTGKSLEQLLIKNNVEIDASNPEKVVLTYSIRQSKKSINIPIVGSVAQKYQVGGVLPKLPEVNFGSQHKLSYSNHIEFINLRQLMVEVPSANNRKEPYIIEGEGFSATLFSAIGEITPDNQVIFIFAGRKINALLPRSGSVRCVLVLTMDEFGEIEDEIPSTIDVLVLEHIVSKTHGYFDKLNLLTARRIGVFVASHLLKLDHFIMMDDNIKNISYNTDNPFAEFDEYYDILHREVANKGCISVATESSRHTREGELGSKLFFVNMQLIRQYLPWPTDMFLLFPGANETLKPLEDYYFQILLKIMLDPLIGYQVLSRDITVLKRSRKQLNACASLGMVASHFVGPDDIETLPLEQKKWLVKTLVEINKVISKNEIAYQNHQSEVENASLSRVHAKARQIKISEHPIHTNISHREGSFIEKYQAQLHEWQDSDNILYPFQFAAIKAVAKASTASCVELATGCGKSMLLYMLASLAFPHLNNDEIIVAVTPQLEITNQLYDSFVKYHKQSNEQRFSIEKIITVSSDSQSISIKLLSRNRDFDNNNYIVIFCLESFEKFCAQFPDYVSKIRLVLLDEFHVYPKAIEKLSDYSFNDALIVGSSATPLKDSFLGNPIYQYTFKQAIVDGHLSPIIVDSLGARYSKENINKLISCLPLILKSQYHPRYRNATTLVTTKTIIFLPSIKQCKTASSILEQAGIPCFIINSDNQERKQNLHAFVNNSKPGVILAVQMLKFGFNDPTLANVIIAKNVHDDDTLRQMLGRPVRKESDKVAYVLTFTDIKMRIDEITKGIPHTYSASIDYLAQNNSYYFCNHQRVWKMCDGDDLPASISATFTITPSDDYSAKQNAYITDVADIDRDVTANYETHSDRNVYDYSSNDDDGSEAEWENKTLLKPKQTLLMRSTSHTNRKRSFEDENSSNLAQRAKFKFE